MNNRSIINDLLPELLISSVDGVTADGETTCCWWLEFCWALDVLVWSSLNEVTDEDAWGVEAVATVVAELTNEAAEVEDEITWGGMAAEFSTICMLAACGANGFWCDATRFDTPATTAIDLGRLRKRRAREKRKDIYY